MSRKFKSIFAAASAFAFIFLSALCAKADGNREFSHAELLAKKEALLNYLRDVAQSDKYLTGQRRNGAASHDAEWKKLEADTGRLPAILSAEYCASSGQKPFPDAEAAMQWKSANAMMAEHWNKGGLVVVNCHFPNPYNEKFGGLRQQIKDKGVAVCTDGTPERARWLALLSEVAKGIKDLNARGIIPEIRVLHESDGGWFWWGTRLPPTVQQKLEDDFLNAVESAGGVAVWHKSWAGLVGGVYRPERYDIVGFDAYDKHARDLSCVKDLYSKTLASGKLFILSEFGPHYPGDNKGKKLEPFDCSDIIPGMDANCPRSLGAVWWAGPWSITNNRNSKEYMNSPRVITLGQVSYKGR